MSVLKLHASTVLDMYLQQRAAIKSATGTVLWCVSDVCIHQPKLTGAVANKLRDYWIQQIDNQVSGWTRLTWVNRLPRKWSDGTLSPEATNTFWTQLKAVVIDLDVMKSVPSKWEMVTEEVKKDLKSAANTLASIVPSFSIPKWALYGMGGLIVLWMLKKR